MLSLLARRFPLKLTLSLKLGARTRGRRCTTRRSTRSAHIYSHAVAHLVGRPPHVRDCPERIQNLLSNNDLHMSFDFPNELQRVIFEDAAKLDGRNARSLVQVARYVNEW